jgi:galactokinase
MKSSLKGLRISTPGRVCLFGEHQDYLNLPVVACAISLRILVTGFKRNDGIININLPDISGRKSFSLNDEIVYTEERDYFKSSVKILLKNSFSFSTGFDCIVKGEIPINAGTSSSSALVLTWINFLTRMSDQSVILPPEQLARFAYEAEVLEFSEPGGMMDQYSTAFGGIISIDFLPEAKVTQLNAKLGTFVLGNSEEPKNTKYILSHVKNRILNIDKQLKEIDFDFSLNNIKVENLTNYKKLLSENQFNLLQGTIKNRDITELARTELNRKNPDDKKIGEMLNEHQKILREDIGISTPKIDRMIQASLNAGANGAKINGSGGGGCMFAYAPEEPEKVKSAIEDVGGKAYIIKTDSGSREEKIDEAKVEER